MKPDELWEKYHLKLSVDWNVIEKSDFLAALKEYGDFRAEETRKQAVSVIDSEIKPFTSAGIIERAQLRHAISNMELP